MPSAVQQERDSSDSDARGAYSLSLEYKINVHNSIYIFRLLSTE